MKTNPKIKQDLYLKEYNLGKTDLEISKILKIPYRTISSFRKNTLKLPLVRDNITITKEQEEILIGTLLGDSSICFTHSQCRFPNLTFSHSEKQEVYFQNKFNSLNCLMSSQLKRHYNKTVFIRGKIANVRPVNYAIGKNLKVLQKYREIFYPEGIKIIPISFLENTFTEKSLAYLFMDDGNKNGTTINLNLQCFKTDNLLEFIFFLKRKFNLEFTLKTDKTLYLKNKSIGKFKELVLPYITTDCIYKIP